MKRKIRSLLSTVLLFILGFSLLFVQPKIQRIRIDKAGATKTLILSGYVPLSVGGLNGFRYFNGGSFDFYSTEFKAINPSTPQFFVTITCKIVGIAVVAFTILNFIRTIL